MNFSEFVHGLMPYCAGQLSKIQFFTEIIGNFITNGAIDSCPLLHTKDDTKSRFISGKRPISKKNAQYLLNNYDKKKFSRWIAQQTEELDSYDDVLLWLKENSISCQNVDDDCENLLVDILKNITKSEICKNSKDALNSDIPSQQTIKTTPFSKRDLTLLPLLAKNFDKLLIHFKGYDPMLIPFKVDDICLIEATCAYWVNHNTDFKNTELTKLKYELVTTFSDYLNYWDPFMSGSVNCSTSELLYLGGKRNRQYYNSVKNKEIHRNNLIEFQKKFYELHKKLNQYLIDADII